MNKLPQSTNTHRTHYRSGDIVQVKSAAEIRESLDSKGNLDGLPFMPEMSKFCGKRFRVFKRADKICVEEEYYIGVKRLRDAVLLEDVRCAGDAHDGCQRMCLIFWKEAWLRPAKEGLEGTTSISVQTDKTYGSIDSSITYYCQSTALRQATEHMSGWDIRQYARDLMSKSLTPWELMKVLFFGVYNKIARTTGRSEFGLVMGEERKTPSVSLGLQKGELVQVKTRSEIAATLDPSGRNRGLQISYEMLRHCGKQFRVQSRIDRMILETTGRMKEIHNTVLLQGTACSGICVRGCARNSHPMWREAWLTRINESDSGTATGVSQDT